MPRRKRKPRVVPQPPMDRSRRPTEARAAIVGLNIAVGGALLLAAGMVRTVTFTGPQDADGGADQASAGADGGGESRTVVLREWQVIAGVTRGQTDFTQGPANGDDYCKT